MAAVERAWRNAAYELQVKQKSERRAAKSARRKERKAKGTEAKAAALVASLSAPPLTRPSIDCLGHPPACRQRSPGLHV